MLMFMLGIYLLTMSGHTYSPDEETMLAASRSLVEQGTWAMPASGSLVQVKGADGRMYSQYGPGQSLAAVPWVAVGDLVGGLFPKDQAGYPLRLVLGSYNALIGAGIVALFGVLGLALGYSRRASLVGALALGFCTFLWPHSRTFFSEPLTTLALLGAFYLLVKDGDGGKPWRGVVAGALVALAIATNVQYVVMVPAFFVYLGWRSWEGSRADARGGFLRLAVRRGAWWAPGLVICLVPLLIYNRLVFGSPFTTGYGLDPTNTLTYPWFDGAFGLLLSPGKGLVWFALPVVLTLWWWPRFAAAHRAETAFIVTATVPVIWLFSIYSFWHGDDSWGPRYLIPVLPLVLLPVMEVFDGGRRTVDEGSLSVNITGRPSSRVAIASVLALGLLVNFLGAVVNFDTYINVVNDDGARHWVPSSSPILGHLTLLTQRVEEWAERI